LELQSWVFATCNNTKKIIESLLSRFVVLGVPEYTFEEFVRIAVNRLGKENIERSYLPNVIKENINRSYHNSTMEIIKNLIIHGKSS